MKKIGLICLVLVLAMGMLGAAYASWSQTLTIKEDVYTGEFCMEFGPQTPTVKDTRKPPPVYPVAEPGDADENATKNFTSVTRTLKNVAWGTANYTAGDHPTGLIVTFHDVYPWYYNHVDFWVHNCGTIPAHLNKILILDAPGGNQLAEITFDGQIVTLDLDGNNTSDFQIIWGNHFGAQFDPCIQINHSFGILVLQDDDPTWQNSTFTFYIEMVFDQFNAP